ncbi:hypothetical protein [Streptomyces sp. cmx-18-6]|uniref:hypothetical protein n=1 Tax=Streptomyces sp. cmx-18-6 TaxID=2790930 RepID=UPI00398105D2
MVNSVLGHLLAGGSTNERLEAAPLAFAGTVPALVLTPPAGVLIDRHPLRTVMITTAGILGRVPGTVLIALAGPAPP